MPHFVFEYQQVIDSTSVNVYLTIIFRCFNFLGNIYTIHIENISACRSVIAMYPISYNKNLINEKIILNIAIGRIRLTNNVTSNYGY